MRRVRWGSNGSTSPNRPWTNRRDRAIDGSGHGRRRPRGRPTAGRRSRGLARPARSGTRCGHPDRCARPSDGGASRARRARHRARSSCVARRPSGSPRAVASGRHTRCLAAGRRQGQGPLDPCRRVPLRADSLRLGRGVATRVRHALTHRPLAACRRARLGLCVDSQAAAHPTGPALSRGLPAREPPPQPRLRRHPLSRVRVRGRRRRVPRSRLAPRPVGRHPAAVHDPVHGVRTDRPGRAPLLRLRPGDATSTTPSAVPASPRRSPGASSHEHARQRLHHPARRPCPRAGHRPRHRQAGR